MIGGSYYGYVLFSLSRKALFHLAEKKNIEQGLVNKRGGSYIIKPLRLKYSLAFEWTWGQELS